MADNLTYRFIHNEGDYFPPGYFNDDFFRKVQEAAGVTKEEELKAMRSPYVALRKDYEDYKNFILEAHTRREDAIKATHAFNTKLLNVLGYPTDHPYEEPYVTGESKKDDSVCEIIPVRHILRNGNNVSMVVMEMQHLVTINDEPQPGLFEQRYQDEEKPGQKPQRYWAGQWRGVIPEKFLDKTRYRFSPAIINKAVTQIFLMEESRRPRYILLLAGNCVFLFDQDKWSRGAYLQFSLDDLFVQGRVNATRFYYALFHLLARKETLAGDGQTVLMASLIEQSYKSAYEVTKDLKEGVVTAVETIANEALHYMKNVAKTNFGKLKKREDGTEYYDETDDEFENEVKDDCITIVYRLLFILFAESRPELGILPTSDQTYKLGYSFEALRDLEQVNLVSEAGRNGYFFDAGIKALFKVLAKGYTPNVGAKATNKSFRVGRIDSPMFDPMRLKHLQGIKLRNVEWQKIIRALSLSHGKNFVGRISYANLGVNQIGSVYESLLAYRGFYAEEDYIEVHKADKPGEGTFLVPYARIDAFADNEILHDKDGNVAKLPKGRFVYRLNGRDRQKSASYYTPEVLTKSTVKYTLKAIIDEVKSGERKATDLLDLKILEPAMGAAAFQNEVINQVAEAYFECRQHELRKKGDKDWRVDPDKYRDELQKTKAYIATRNVYGVDLNPTAVELGKLSLWLNVIHKNMQTPFFANHLALGNAVVGAWLKAYSREDVVGIKSRNGKKLEKNAWWEKAPHKVKFQKKRVARSVNDVYHFLLPDENMLAVRSIREQKLNHPEEARRMTELIKDWTKPVTEKDFRRLQYLSGMIDVLLREHYEYQMSMEEYTFSRKNLWGMPGREQGNQLDLDGSDWYATKERLFKARFAHDSAYFRVKMVMDFWCSLWFWDFAEAAKLPTRDEFWDEIEKMLNVDESKLEKGAQEAFREYKTGMAALTQLDLGLFTQPPEEPADDATPDFKLLAKEAILAAGSTQGYFSNSPRFQLVKSYSDRYRFFHPMLDFLEVFWSRGGFDVICGNPPWIVTQFDEVSVISEKFPEVAIKKVSAPDVRNMRGQFLANASQNQIFFDEQTDCYCSSVFMNAMCSYPLLIGQKANLYKCVLTNCFDLVNANGYTGLLTPESIYDDPKGDALREELYMRLRYHFQYQNELRLFAEVHHRASLRSAICSILLQWMHVLHMTVMANVKVKKQKMGNGMSTGIKIELFGLMKKHYVC